MPLISPRMNLPNRLTIARIGLTGLFVSALLLPHFPAGKTVAFVVFLVASLTDWYDGWLARRSGPTRLGAVIDPLADKALAIAQMEERDNSPMMIQPNIGPYTR
jgi:phosphatidylglycerophosphate synthase